MVLDTDLLNTQHYKVRIKGKVERSPLHFGVGAIIKGTFGSPSTKVASFIYFYFYQMIEIFQAAVVYSIVVVGELKLLDSVYNLEAAKINVLFGNL